VVSTPVGPWPGPSLGLSLAPWAAHPCSAGVVPLWQSCGIRSAGRKGLGASASGRRACGGHGLCWRAIAAVVAAPTRLGGDPICRSALPVCLAPAGVASAAPSWWRSGRCGALVGQGGGARLADAKAIWGLAERWLSRPAPCSGSVPGKPPPAGRSGLGRLGPRWAALGLRPSFFDRPGCSGGPLRRTAAAESGGKGWGDGERPIELVLGFATLTATALHLLGGVSAPRSSRSGASVEVLVLQRQGRTGRSFETGPANDPAEQAGAARQAGLPRRGLGPLLLPEGSLVLGQNLAQPGAG